LHSTTGCVSMMLFNMYMFITHIRSYSCFLMTNRDDFIKRYLATHAILPEKEAIDLIEALALIPFN
jgi:hypothetical protein